MGRLITKDELERVAEKYSDLLQQYMSYEYPITIYEDNGLWVAEIEDLPGCMSFGDTKEEALANLDEAKRNWFLLAFHAGVFPKKPKEMEKEDRVLLRIPTELHLKIAKLASQEGKSFNSYVIGVLRKHIDRKTFIFNTPYIEVSFYETIRGRKIHVKQFAA